MTCGIYKITNKTNGKVYIGQSRIIEKRWYNHIHDATNSNKKAFESLLGRAIRKHGVDKFSFEILEECPVEKLNEREIYWIAEYDATNQDIGYNILAGGNQESTTTYSDETVKLIIQLLREGELSQNEIAEETGVSRTTVSGINLGYFRNNPNIRYPIKDYVRPQRKKNCCIDCKKEISASSTRCIECAGIYQRKVVRPSKEELSQLIYQYTFTELGRMFDVFDNTVRKWCAGYGLPTREREIRPKEPKIRSTHSDPKPVYQIDPKTDEILACFDSIADAERALGQGKKSHIGKVIKGERKTALGYKWKLIE